MIEIDSVTLRNFMSFGNYDTTIKIARLGPCLVVGEVVDDDGTVIGSIGAGKSAAHNSIQWCLFGRTMYNPQSARGVANWDSDGDCVVSVVLCNGDRITRTLKRTGSMELSLQCNDQTTGSVLATTAAMQTFVATRYGIDWEAFIGSVCFNQFSKPWLSLTPEQRRRALERLLRIDRFEIYATVARKKMAAAQTSLVTKETAASTAQVDADHLTIRLTETTASRGRFSGDRKARLEALVKEAAQHRAALVKLLQIDTKALERRWVAYADRLSAITKQDRAAQLLDNLTASRATKLAEIEALRASWVNRLNVHCLACGQLISADLVEAEVAALDDQYTTQTEEHIAAAAEAVVAHQEVAAARMALEAHKPALTVTEAEAHNRTRQHYVDLLESCIRRAEDIAAEQNPYGSIVADLTAKLKTATDRAEQRRRAMDLEALQVRHLDCIYHAYHDRDKIKMAMLGDGIQHLNAKLTHYCELFGLKHTVQFDQSLTANYERWSYNYMSGGERDKLNLAMMFAAHDLDEDLYGKQANFIVLDEVDRAFGEREAGALGQLIIDELAQRADAILVISHKNQLAGILPQQLVIVNDGGQSRLVRS